MPLILLPLGAAACDGDNDSTSTPTTAANATVAATPTVDPIGPGEPDGERVLADLRALADDIGPRAAGSDGEAKARAYLQQRLESMGYEVTQQAFPFAASRFLPGRIDVGEQAFGAYSMLGSAFANASGPIVYAGRGAPENFPAGGLNGAIALVDRGELLLGEKARNAQAAGASAVLIANNAPGNFIGDLNGDVTLPVLGIRQGDGEVLRGIAGTATVVTITLPPPSGTSYNVIARPAGTTAPCETLTGGHYDTVAVTGGAHDNASGTAGVIEAARLVAANKPPGIHCFAAFGAEELGLIGSEYYVNAMTDAERAALKVMVNLDMIGGEQDLTLIGSDDMTEVARIEADELNVPAEVGELVGASSDHASFENAGVPVVFFNRNDALIHTAQDVSGRMSAEQLEDAMRVVWATLLQVSQ